MMPAMPLLPRTITSLADVRRVKLDPERVRAHVIRPAHLDDVVSSRGPLDPLRGPSFEFVGAPGLYYFDAAGFADSLHAALKDRVAGYAMRLLRHGTPLQTRTWNWAKTPTDGSDAWALATRMHVASVSKFITAVAMTRVMHERQIAVDTPIAGFLPAYWTKGPNVDQVTFRHLLTHRSGFVTGKSDSDFSFMKSQVAAGAGALGSFAYENMNFGLCRILLATILGSIATNATFMLFGMDLNDVFWDFLTIDAYARYVQELVFAPAGVSGPTLDRREADALAYDFPVSGGGWNSGDLRTMAGGVAWHMSVQELLAVMSAVRRGGTIMTPARAQTMLDASFGIDDQKNTPLGWLYWKGGYWGDPMGHREQSLVYFLPREMELALVANSPVGSPERSFPDAVYGAFIANVHPATSLRDFLIRHNHPVTTSVHALTAPANSLREMLPG
jgi:CubicO group peptidase (beta-lactamase class C family)